MMGFKNVDVTKKFHWHVIQDHCLTESEIVEVVDILENDISYVGWPINTHVISNYRVKANCFLTIS